MPAARVNHWLTTLVDCCNSRAFCQSVREDTPLRIHLRNLILTSAALAALPGSVPLARADVIHTGMLYVADYGKSVLDRYQYTYDQTLNSITSIGPYGIGGNTTSAFFLGGSSMPIKEGLQGTSNDLITVIGAHGSTATTLERVALDGTLIGAIPVDFSAYNGGNVGIGNVAITADGRYMYAPLETGNAIVKIDLTNGAIVASYAFASAHDVAIAANGDVYAADYAAGSPKVIRLDSNLVYQQDLVTALPAGVTGSFSPTGISVAADGSIYVDNNTRTGSDSVLHYTFTGSAGTLTAHYDSPGSYVGNTSTYGLDFTFGNNIGPDGNLYIAALGGGGSGTFSVKNGYVDGIYQLNTSNESVSQFVQGFTETGGSVGPSGLSAPKYLQFDTNFVDAPDAGLVPEPGTSALGLAALACFALRRHS